MKDKLDGRYVVDQVAAVKRTVDVLQTIRGGIADSNTWREFEVWQVITMLMLDYQTKELQTVVEDLESQFDLSVFNKATNLA